MSDYPERANIPNMYPQQQMPVMSCTTDSMDGGNNQHMMEDCDDDRPRESPFMGNHIVKTVRNLKRIK